MSLAGAMDVHTELGDARNVLLSAPSMSGDERGVCTDLLFGADPAETSVLWVTFRRDPDACLDQWTATTGDRPHWRQSVPALPSASAENIRF